MNTPEEDNEPTIKGINAADLLARGLESAKAATGNPQAWQPPTPEELAALLPQYEIESLLGRGGMGAVYRGKQAALDRAVAIKLLPAELAADAEFMSRFQREARTLARLQHPGIVAVHDFGQTSQGHLYFVMEFVNGTDLARLIHGPGVNSAQALEIIAQVCEALQYAHSQGVIHRDIKPANVLINQEGRAKLADFGLARPTSEETASLTRSNVVMGTPDYMAPEQMAGNADHRADLYALGVMLYEMLTGQTPRGAWAPPSQRVQVDVRLDQVVVRALQQDPAMRYQQASEIKTDVDVIRTTPLPKMGKGKAKSAPEAPGQRTTPLPKAKKPGSKVVWAAAVLVVLALSGWWLVKNQKSSSALASDVPWHRVERSAEEWAKTGQTLKDGWITFDSGYKVVPLFDLAPENRDTQVFVVRARAIFHDAEANFDISNQKLPGSGRRGVQFYRNKQNYRNGALGGPSTLRHEAPVEIGQEAVVEFLFDGTKAHTRFNGKSAASGDMAPALPWKTAFIIGPSEFSVSLRNIEYAILDGIPDPLKALGWEVAEENSSKPAVATPSEAVLKARERGGRLRVFGNMQKGPVELGKAAEFSDFQTVVVSNNGWAARRKGGETFCMAGLESSFAGPAVELGPFLTSFLQRGGWGPVMQMKTDGSYRNLFGSGASQVRLEWANFRAVAFLNPGNYLLSLDEGGNILRGEHWHGAEKTDRIPPPSDFFLGATAYTSVTDHYIAARPGLPVRSFSARTGQVIDFPSNIREIVEMDAYDKQIIMRDDSGQVFVVTPDGKSHDTIPPDIGPAIAVRAGANMFAAQRTDGTWRAWGEAEGLVAQTARLGHAVDLDFHSEAGGKISYMLWIEPVDDSTATTAPTPENPPVTPSEAVLKARNDGGKLMIWGKTRRGPASVGGAAAFDDFVQVAAEADGWAARRTSKEETWLAASAANLSVKDVPFSVKGRSLSRAALITVLDGKDGAYRDPIYFDGAVTEPKAVTLIKTDGMTLWLGDGGVLLASKIIKNEERIKPPDDFFAGASAFTASEEKFLTVRKAASVESWNPRTGQKHAFPIRSDDVLEMDAAADFVAILSKDGQVRLFMDDARALRSADPRLKKAPSNPGPFVAVRAGRGMVAAQKPDGSWLAWGESDALAQKVAGLGHMVDLDLDYAPQGAELLIWIEPVDGSASASPKPTNPTSAAEAKKRLVEARAHLKAGEVAEARKIAEEALATAPGDLATMAEAALILAEAQAPERASLLAGDFVKQAPAEHPQFAAITELRVKLMPTLKQYQARLDAAAKLVTANDDAGEQRELQAALKILPDGREAAARLEKNPLHVGRPLPGRRWAGALGHTYVPVDGLANVLFSTWETRVKDFEQFVKETGHDMSEPRDSTNKTLTWQKPGFEQTGDHPVVLVGREDAEFFCRWLTDKERKTGRLLPGQVYRLPTDREWSAAMGVLDEPGDFPACRKFPTDVFTWPKDTHPAHNAENLNWKNDDFPNTAPVGSGKPNRFGLHDLLGNVQELCADPWDFTWANGTLRGNSYRDTGTVALRRLLADRDGNYYYGRPDSGFRTVLDLKTEGQRQMQIAFEQAWQKFCDAAEPRDVPTRRRARALINDEMLLLDLSRANWSSEKTLSYFADLPVTHLYAEGGGMTGAMQVTKKWPLRVLSLHTLLGVKADFLESFRGLPLEWINLNLNVNGSGIKTQKSLDALRGMKLKGLWLWSFTHLESIEPLRGIPLENLRLMDGTSRVDMSPVKDAPLRVVQLSKQATLADIFQACEWWGSTAATLSVPVQEALTAALREPVVAGNAAGVQKLVSEVETRMKTIPYFTQGKAPEWMTTAVSEHLRFSNAAVKWLEGDPSAFDGLTQSFNGHTYLSVPLYLNYTGAKAFAEKLGAHLVTITTPEESAFLSQARESNKLNGARIGLERTGEGRMAWKWVTGEPLEYHYWGPNSGQSGDAAGLQNHGGGNWNWWHWGKADLMSSIIEWDTPTPQPPGKKSGASSPARSQREVAERLLGLKAELRIRQPGKQMNVRFGDLLPEGDFSIYEIIFPMTAKATDESFALVAGAPDLHKLLVNGPVTTLAPVAGLKKLFDLSVYAGIDGENGGSLPEDEMRHLAGLRELESLTLSWVQFTGKGCRHLADATKLKTLFLGRNGRILRPLDESGAAAIARLKTVTNLTLRGNVFDPANPAAFRVVAAMPDLTNLDLGTTTITRDMLAEIARMPKLQRLNLSTCELQSQEFSLLAPCADRLTALTFGYDTNLSDAGVKEIANTLVNLKEFVLGWKNDCTGAALRELARLPKLHDFRCQKRDGLIKPEDFEALTQFPVLNQLSLASCGLTDDCVKSLGQCPNLAAVNLSSNDQVTDAALTYLHTSKTIRYVEVTGTAVTDTGVAALQQALPGCEVKR